MDKLIINFTRTLFLLLITNISTSNLYAQIYNSKIANYINRVEHPFNFLQKIEHLGVKMSGSIALDSTYIWLKRNIENIGYQTKTQKFLNYKDTLKNIEFVKHGSNDSSIIICAHYDSWVGTGVNDNGTGNFALYQFAKLIKPLSTKYTIRFIYFSGEELGFLGSQHYVKFLDKDSVKIKYVINFDQLGGTVDQDNSGVKCERDEESNKKAESNLIAESLSKSYSLYTNLIPHITKAYSSDYVSFRDSGYIISGIYQYSSFPQYHSESDLLTYVEFNSLISVVKGALASILYFSEADLSTWNINNVPSSDKITVYNTHNGLKVINASGYSVSIIDPLGREVLTQNCNENECSFALKALPPGLYLGTFRHGENIFYKKFFINQ